MSQETQPPIDEKSAPVIPAERRRAERRTLATAPEREGRSSRRGNEDLIDTFLDLQTAKLKAQTELGDSNPDRAYTAFTESLIEFDRVSAVDKKIIVKHDRQAIFEKLSSVYRSQLVLIIDISIANGDFPAELATERMLEIEQKEKAFGRTPLKRKLSLTLEAKTTADNLLSSSFEHFLERWENHLRFLHKPEEEILAAIDKERERFYAASPRGKTGIAKTLMEKLQLFYETAIITLLEGINDSKLKRRYLKLQEGTSFKQKEQMIKELEAITKRGST